MNKFYSDYGSGLEIRSWMHAHWAALTFLILWTIFWKGLALWHAGRKAQPWWFVVLLIVNTAGILELIYLFAIIKLKFTELFSKN